VPALPERAAGVAALCSRRRFLLGASAMAASLPWLKAAADPPQAMISISLDLEMARHYPTWEHTHWDYEKGIWTKTL
jgi:hypothetical protein